MKEYNVVTNQNIINDIKTSKYFRVNLGMAITTEGKEGRILSDKDHFAASYNYQYKTSIYAKGNIGGIKFYLDHFIKDDVLAIYYNLEEFVFEYDRKFTIENGIDSYVGYLLKSVDEKYEQLNLKKEADTTKKKGDASILSKNPGSVSYEDIKDYIKNKKIV